MKKIAAITMAIILCTGYSPVSVMAQESIDNTVISSEIGMNAELDEDSENQDTSSEETDISLEEGGNDFKVPEEEFESDANPDETSDEDFDEYYDEDSPKEVLTPSLSLIDSADGNYAAEFAQLQTFINDAPTDGTETVIYITKDIEIINTFSIQGKNIKLLSDPQSGEIYRLVYGGASNMFSLVGQAETILTLENLILDGNNDSFSGFITTNGNCHIYLNDGAIIENADVSQAINNSKYLEINGAEIRNITSVMGAIYGESGEIVVNSGYFHDNIRGNQNTSTYGSVINVLRSGLTINSGEFSDNFSNSHGGAVGIWPATTSQPYLIQNALFINNESAGRGGAIYVYQGSDELTINNCSFIGNTALQYGGGVSITSTGQPTYNITNCIFDSNTSVNEYGGGLFIENGSNNGKTSLTNVSASNNSAGHAGGGIYLTGKAQEIEIENINVSNNKAGTLEGAVNAYYVGGGLYISAGNSTLHMSGTNVIKDNTLVNPNPDTTTRTDAGGMYISGDTGAKLYIDISIEGSLLIENNTITSSADTVNYGGGGFFYLVRGTIENIIVKNNATDGNGGGVAFGASTTVTIKDSEIYNNYSAKNGGGVYFSSVTNPRLENVQIEHNTTLGSGGGIVYATATTTSRLYLTDGTSLTYNRALNGNGGGIYIFHSDGSGIQHLITSDSDTDFYGNSAVKRYDIPSDAFTAYPTVEFSRTSIDIHPLNNFDINYADTPENNDYVTITYDPNTGTGNAYTTNWSVITPYTVLSDDFLGYIKSGYTFLGWSENPDAEEADILPGQELSGFTNGDVITLYAQWQEIKYTATINYHPNGGMGSIYSVITDIKNPHTVLDNDITGFTLDKYEFTGWSTASGTQDVDYIAGNTIDGLSSGQSFDLYAQWKEIQTTTPPDENENKGGGGGGGEGTLNQHKVTFYWNDGTDNIYATETVANGGRVSRPDDPERAEYKFTGWYTSEECITLYNFSAPVYSNLRLYAGWEPLVLPQFTTDHYAYIVGYDNGTVHPEGQITRAEVATIFFRMLDDEYRDTVYSKTNEYSDVNADHWFNIAVSTMTQSGTLHGYPDGTFNPNGYITRGEFATVIAQFTGGQYNGDDLFSDISGHWAQKYINHASNIGWIEGYPDGSYKPNSFITRAETVSLVNRILERNPESTEDLHEDMIEWPDNMDITKWYYLDIQEATNSHDYDIKDNGHEEWTALRSNRDWRLLER